MMNSKIAIPHDVILLYQMLDAAHEAVSFCDGLTCSVLDTNRMLFMALTKEIEIIGGIAENVSEVIRNQHPEIPWRAIIDMRNHLIHGYFDVDADQVWSTVVQDLPALMVSLEKIIPKDTA